MLGPYFFVLALVAAFFGFGGIATAATGIAVFMISLIMHGTRRTV